MANFNLSQGALQAARFVPCSRAPMCAALAGVALIGKVIESFTAGFCPGMA